ncbi:MAG: amidohydrolase family protein, partial [Polyangiales bacterium]
RARLGGRAVSSARRARNVVAAAAVAAYAIVAAPGTSLAEPDTLAIVGAEVRVGDGTVVENGTVIVRDGRIVSVTKGGDAPTGATVIDGKGKVLTPGFVAVGNEVGLIEIELEPTTDDAAPQDDDGIHPAFGAVDGYNPDSSLIPITRLAGVTSVVPAPGVGLVSGTSAWFDLRPGTPAEVTVKPLAAVHANLSTGAVDRFGGGARPEAFARLRQLLDDARLYRTAKAAYDKRAMRETRATQADLERLGEVLAGKLPLVVWVSRSADILRVLDVAKAYRVRLVLAGVEEGWKVASAIAAAEVPVLVRPLTNLPEQFDRLQSRYDNAALLQKAGVTVIPVAMGPHDARQLREQVGNAIAWGLDPAHALRGITLEPARLFGLDSDYGTVAKGKVANLALWTGDPFDLRTWATNVIIQGRAMPMRSRQTALFERYKVLRPGEEGRGMPRW